MTILRNPLLQATRFRGRPGYSERYGNWKLRQSRLRANVVFAVIFSEDCLLTRRKPDAPFSAPSVEL